MHRSGSVHVVAIAGPSGSGKTSLARLIAGRVTGGGVVFPLDAYYRDQRGVPDDAINVDVPDAIEQDLALDHLRVLERGASVEQPVYDYATHSRTPSTRIIDPAPTVIVDGLYALYWAELRERIHTAVFLTLDHDRCRERRVARDTRERGRSRSSVEDQYERTVRPMYDRYVDATRRYADLVLDASQPLDSLAGQVLARISSVRPPS